MDASSNKGSFNCLDHSDSQCCFISLAKGSCQKRLLCGECLYLEKEKQLKSDLKHIMPLSLVLRCPEKMIDKLKNDIESHYLIQFCNQYSKDLEKDFDQQIIKFALLEQIYGQIKEDFKQQLKQFKDFQAQLKKLAEQFQDVLCYQEQKIQFNSFCQLLTQLRQLDQSKNSDQYVQLSQKISAIINDMQKDNCSNIQKEIKELMKNHQNLKTNITKLASDKFVQQISDLFKQHEEFITNISQSLYPIILSPLLSDNFKEELKKKFKTHGKQVSQFQLIYSGLTDGLNYNSYMNKTSGKNSLMIVCKSNNDGYHVFGGYYPGQWIFNGSYQGDDTGTSFLFSQTRNQIYPLIQQYKANAQWLGGGYAIYMGQDLDIRADFINGSSNLGQYYSKEQYQIQQNHLHLYGGLTPNVIACEVYQILF